MQFEHIVDVHLEQGRLAEVELGPTLYEDDSNGLKLGVRLWRNGEAVAVTGTVSGWAIVSTGQTISPFDDTGSEDNLAWVLVPQGALIPGRVEIFLRITGDSDSAVTLHATGTVRRTKTGEIIVPGDPLPDVDAMRQIAADCVAATGAAESVDGRVNALHHLVDYDYGTDYEETVTPETGSSVTATRHGTRWTFDGHFVNKSTSYKWIANGTPAGFISTAPTHDGLKLVDGHTYRLRLRHISGTVRTWVNIMWVLPGTTARISGTTSVESGADMISDLTYDAATYTDGVWPVVVVNRSQANDLSAYNAEILIEDLTYSQGVTVTGTEVAITAVSGSRYMCGTLDSLTFTPSAEGLCEVIFTAGSSMVTPLLPSTVRMPDWWSGVEAGRTYDLMVLDGTLGAVMSWA